MRGDRLTAIDDGVNLSRPSIYEVKSTLVAPCLSLPVSTVAICASAGTIIRGSTRCR